jgi:hypothetical protein
MIERVRSKWEEFPELQTCHHFVYDYEYRKGNNKVLFMGINPGEVKADWENYPNGRCEESMHFNFRKNYPLPLNSKKWFNLVNDLIPEKHGIIQSELFFWSSNNLTELKKRIPNWLNGPIMNFCVLANQWIIKERKIKIVIVSGVGQIKLISKLYNLKLTNKIFDEQNRRLVEIYISNQGIKWLFTLHLTSTRGLTNISKNNIKKIIHEQYKLINN